MKIIGIIPARMAASRFPGKPLHKIWGMPMVEHVYRRAALFPGWDGLFLATCDREIAELGEARAWPTMMTSDQHTRALDRVAEAAEKCGIDLDANDIIVCVQGDEPMLHPDMIAAVLKPLQEYPAVPCTVLAITIGDEEQYHDPNILKIIHDRKGDVLYTSRAPIPYCKQFPPATGARRIGGIFAFRSYFLKIFTGLPESPLEVVESCDSNRILDNGYRQRIAPYPSVASFSIDCPSDAEKVEAHMQDDPLWKLYRK
ncbi:MAG: 3-deoxy-manno-octulosonate cytidylyltransferase [Deltaproteobacteria bacterium]|nr:3-deoxy-manno-octulosonate cytidylyltransferase [Deltaproteobacteria bacterium]